MANKSKKSKIKKNNSDNFFQNDSYDYKDLYGNYGNYDDYDFPSELEPPLMFENLCSLFNKQTKSAIELTKLILENTQNTNYSAEDIMNIFKKAYTTINIATAETLDNILAE